MLAELGHFDCRVMSYDAIFGLACLKTMLEKKIYQRSIAFFRKLTFLIFSSVRAEVANGHPLSFLFFLEGERDEREPSTSTMTLHKPSKL